ncbi:hypothetical protein cypCar_00026451, partial [Cyprinus carpio]
VLAGVAGWQTGVKTELTVQNGVAHANQPDLDIMEWENSSIRVNTILSLPTDTDVIYKCQEDQDNIATLAAVRFINDHHRHGYKFKFVSLDSRSADEKTDPCGVILGITLEETECHIVNPKPLDQCNTRMETETRYGFCKSSKVGNEEPEVECEIFEAQNITHPMKHPAQSRKDCKFHGRPGHAGHDHKDKTPDHSGHPEHAGHDHKDKKHDHRVHPEHPPLSTSVQKALQEFQNRHLRVAMSSHAMAL